MDILHEYNEMFGSFIAKEANEKMGELTYRIGGDHDLVLEETNVNIKFNDKGVGKALVMEAVLFARKNKVKIQVFCPFARSILLRKREDFKDDLQK